MKIGFNKKIINDIKNNITNLNSAYFYEDYEVTVNGNAKREVARFDTNITGDVDLCGYICRNANTGAPSHIQTLNYSKSSNQIAFVYDAESSATFTMSIRCFFKRN